MIYLPSPPFSSSPSLFLRGNADKRVVLGADKPSEGVATSLRFSSQPGSFSPGSYGSDAGPPDEQPDSPIKTSPVSERIKALEALAAKKREPDFRSDGGFPHFRERHFEKSPTETVAPTVQKKGSSVEQESPESPFEVLGDLRHASEFEETADWMKTHIPPVPDFDDALDLLKVTLASERSTTSKKVKESDAVIPEAPAAFAGVPDAFMDSPKPKDELGDPQKQPSVEEESEFDLSFLPRAYMWDQQEKSGVQAQSNLHSALPPSPAGFGAPPPPVSPPVCVDAKQNDLDANKTSWAGDFDPPETSEVDSSGESDDTVIEDGVSAPAAVLHPAATNDPTPSPVPQEKETPPARAERKLMQVPTINVIETDEPNYSEEEMEMELEAEEDEGYEVVKEPEHAEAEPPKTRPLETEFMEGYSPPSSPVDSDAECSPKHKILESNTETAHQESLFKTDALTNTAASQVSKSDFPQVQPEKMQPTTNTLNNDPFVVSKEEVDFPDNDDEWSDQLQDILFKPGKPDLTAQESAHPTKSDADVKTRTAEKEAYIETVSLSKSSFMQDDIYDRQSFDYDYDSPAALDNIHDEKELNHARVTPNDVPEDAQKLDDFGPINDDKSFSKSDGQVSSRRYPPDPYSSFQSEPLSNIKDPDSHKKMSGDIVTDDSKSVLVQNIDSKIQKDTNAGKENIERDLSECGPNDSFVDFMRECLKSRQDEESDSIGQDVKVSETSSPASRSPPTMVMDLEQERLTISALKELGSSQDEEEVAVFQPRTNNRDRDKADRIAASPSQSSFTSTPNPPCSLAMDSTYSKEVEAIDEWMAEAYHLAEHVLTAILTHLSGNASSSWAIGPLTSCSRLNLSHLHLFTCSILLPEVCFCVLCSNM